ncbi:phospholipase D-like domain-containing protein, partial [Arthrospira platensis SPKY1]|nr:phospholipase D-like domain-containing protein [Arthrospira platensis SPKY1]
VRRGYHRALATARHSLTVAASYFLPKRHIIKLLRKSAERGVETRLILPAHTDVPFYSTAVKYLYPRLLRAGVKIYEYLPSVLHAKVAVADGRWCSIGSYNLNDLSDLLSVELNIEVFDHAIARQLQAQLDEVIARDCREVDVNEYLNASWTARLKWKLYYLGILQSIRILHWFTDDRK